MTEISNKPARRLRLLIILACLFSGILAGENVYRYIIEVPAWRHLPINDWAEYSRHADLGNGIYLFPVEAFVSAILLVIAYIIVLSGRSDFKNLAWPVQTATFFSLAGLILTFFAAPVILSLGNTDNNPVILQKIFDRFHFWGLCRAVAQTLSFLGCILSASKLVNGEW